MIQSHERSNLEKKNVVTILVADDDEEDRMMISDAFRESRLKNQIRFVENGVELMDYLHHRGKYSSAQEHPLPGIILLDLNMPKMDGREALKEIKSNAELKRIPVVVLTTSKAEEDIYRTYNLGVNSFVSKPVTFESLVNIIREIGRYWFEIVELPSEVKK